MPLLNEKKHEEVYLTAKKACEWFDSLDFEYIPGKLLFLNIQVVYAIQNREFEDGADLLTKALSYISPKSQHWFRLKENEIILNFHKGDFNSAVHTFFEAINKNTFAVLGQKTTRRVSVLLFSLEKLRSSLEIVKPESAPSDSTCPFASICKTLSPAETG